MPRECYVCGKTARVGNKVSHSNRKTKRLFKPNLQKIKMKVGKIVKSVLVCTKCLKKNKAKKVI